MNKHTLNNRLKEILAAVYDLPIDYKEKIINKVSDMVLKEQQMKVVDALSETDDKLLMTEIINNYALLQTCATHEDEDAQAVLVGLGFAMASPKWLQDNFLTIKENFFNFRKKKLDKRNR